DEARYERMMMPTAQTLLDRERAADLARSRKGAPSVDVWSGKALNDLLGSMVKARLGAGPSIPLDDDVLKGINLTDAGTTGNLGLLKEAKDDGKLPWPRSLTSPRFDKLRARVERSAQDALFSIKREKKAPEEATLNNLGRALKALADELSGSASEMSPSQYIQAKRFLSQLTDARRALEGPKVGANFNRTP